MTHVDIFSLPTITDEPTENPDITLPMHITTKSSAAVNENPMIESNVNTIKDDFRPSLFIRQPTKYKLQQLSLAIYVNVIYWNFTKKVFIFNHYLPATKDPKMPPIAKHDPIHDASSSVIDNPNS